MFETGYFLTIPQILGAVRRRWFPATLLAFLITLSAGVALFCIRDIFQSEGSLYVKAGRFLTVDPTATTSQTSSLLDTRQTEIQSIKEMLGTRSLLESVADKVGIDRVMEQRSTLARWMESLQSVRSSILGKKKLEALTEDEIIALERMETCVEYIASHLKIKASKDGNTVTVTCRAHSPFLAHDLVDNIMNEFKARYVSVHHNRGSVEFFEEEKVKSNQLVLESESNLRDLKDELEMMSVDDKRSLIQQEIAALQSELILTTSALISVEAEIEHLTRKIDQQPEFVAQETTDKPSYASDLMRQNLYTLEVTESELKSKYSDSHPLLVQVRDKLLKLREIYDDHGERTGESKKAVNPTRQKLEMDLITAIVRKESLAAKQTGIEQERLLGKAKMRELNTAEIRIAESQRMVDQAREVHQTYSKKLEEARIQDRADQNKLTDIRIYQPPTLQLEKASPPRMLLFAASMIGSAFIGLAFAVWRDQNDYRTALARSGVPIVVGAMSSIDDRANRSETLSDAITGSRRPRADRSSKTTDAAVLHSNRTGVIVTKELPKEVADETVDRSKDEKAHDKIAT